jgi:hypothetical protein
VLPDIHAQFLGDLRRCESMGCRKWRRSGAAMARVWLQMWVLTCSGRGSMMCAAMTTYRRFSRFLDGRKDFGFTHSIRDSDQSWLL